MDTLKHEFDHYLAGIAWSLWKELGVAGTDRFHENCLVQLEELIILTTIIAKSDPRLRDEALDWLSRYHTYISISRLRTFLKDLDADVKSDFSQFAQALNAVSSAKWLNEKVTAHYNIKLSGKSSLPTLQCPSLLMLRLRNLFGPSAKADLLTYFLTSNRLHFSAADLVEIGYSKRSLMTALDHLASSEVLSVTKLRNQNHYALKKPRELQVIVGKLPKIAPPWSKILRAIITIHSAIPKIQNSSRQTQVVILRNCLIEIEPLLPIFISPILHNKPDFERDWKALMGIFNAFQQGNFFSEFEVHSDFDKLVIHLLRELYQVDDCMDGIETIEDKRQTKRHEDVYKECYQLFLSFVGDLRERLQQFLNFPFHKIMDEPLADIPYRFSKERLPLLLEKIGLLEPINEISNAQLAVRQYQTFMPEFHVVQQFIYTFRKRLEDLYFVKTDMPSTAGDKRHLVYNLFSQSAGDYT